ncbi:hypothetical protein ABLE91_02950 [Aquabacter sp. CN5-332]|uniref:DUF6968 family protein n=1 Tax=Aquabacter sp. CN5-332 TaxID=3156608 RepID=UPI0032B426AA
MIIAERVLRMEMPDGAVDVPIRLFAPLPFDNHWACRWEIHWPDGVESFEGCGLDSVQALYIAMQMVGINLYLSDPHEDGLMHWGTWKGYGFPVTSNMRDELAEDDLRL